MNKKCARCEKTVYPTEEVKCLDTVWHKFCFKCDVCGMTLNMKNYKGYDKRPYCSTHYPTTKHTAVAETPEMRRIAENTKIQSNVQYHGDFERSKGTYQCLADNREIMRHKQNQLNSSLITYHADYEKLKGKKTSVMDDPEIMRIKKNTAIQSNVQYQNIAQRKTEMEARRPEQVVEGSRGRTNPGKISDYDPQFSPQASGIQYQSSQPVNRNSRHAEEAANRNSRHAEEAANRNSRHAEEAANRNSRHAEEAARADAYDSQRRDAQNGQRRQPGSITDYDPMAGFKGQGYSPAPPQPMYQGGYGQPQGPKKPSYTAIYDYSAADDDEVSFREGDVVINCEIIDQGWMTGTIQRTGETGMLPSNYVEAM